jgi:hypothetical protein
MDLELLVMVKDETSTVIELEEVHFVANVVGNPLGFGMMRRTTTFHCVITVHCSPNGSPSLRSANRFTQFTLHE